MTYDVHSRQRIHYSEVECLLRDVSRIRRIAIYTCVNTGYASI